MKRNTQQRRRQIIETLSQQGETSVETLAALYGTSEVTIRKDLAALEENGLVVRRFGGAILMPIESADFSPAFQLPQSCSTIITAAQDIIPVSKLTICF